MKSCSVIVALALTTVSIGCGGNGDTATSADVSVGQQTVSETTQAQQGAAHPLPALPANRGPLKDLVVKDLEVGKGPVAGWGDVATVRYVGVFWKTGTVFAQYWQSPTPFKLNGKTFGPGWQEGIEGMRVGGRRELWIPSALYFNDGTDTAYVVALDKVKSGATGKEGS